MGGFAKTPRYVLHEGAYPACPFLAQTSSNARFVVIYGFSDKSAYDCFLSGSSLALTPYPLAKLFLVRQIEQDAGALKLIVLDASFSSDRLVFAATFDSVLQSMRLGLDSVAVSHQLIFDRLSPGYQIEESPLFLPLERM